jgi:hypothetical protein
LVAAASTTKMIANISDPPRHDPSLPRAARMRFVGTRPPAI